MAITSTPLWMQNGQYNAKDDRLLLKTLVPTQGIASGFKVIQTTTASMNVQVPAGSAFIDAGTGEGSYHIVNDGTITATATAAHATYTRIDRVVLTVRDSSVSGTNNDAVVTVVKGTPASSPVAPAVPSLSITLALLTITANAVTVTNARINTAIANVARLNNSLSPQSLLCTSTTRPTASITEGMVIQETDTGFTRIRVGNVWRLMTGEQNISTAEVIQTTYSGWKVTSAYSRLRGTTISGYINFTRTGGAISVSSSGNIVNQNIALLREDYRPGLTTAATPIGSGRNVGGYVSAGGGVVLANVAPPNNIVTNEDFSLGWTSIIPTSLWQVT